MLRIHFDVDDLARLRVVNSVGPVLESVFALDVFHQAHTSALLGWRREVHAALGPRVAEVAQLRHRRSARHLLWAARREQVRPLGAAPTETPVDRASAATVFEFCKLAVGPFWPALSMYLQEQREVRSRIVIGQGIDGLLRTLHPQAVWEPPVLHVPHQDDFDVALDGRGLELVPSIFLADGLCVMHRLGSPQDALTLAFAVSVDARMGDLLRNSITAQEWGLPALVGPTRAAALQIIAETSSTGELSERLGISLAGASKHAKVLRMAGLVTTARNRNTSLHALTTLGMALLQGRH